MKPIIITIIFISGFMLFTGSALAQFETAIWDTLTSDSSRNYITSKSLATTPFQLHFAYAEDNRICGSNVYYRFFDMLAGWGEPRAVETSIPCNNPVIAARYNTQYDIAILFESGEDIYGWIAHDPMDPWTPENVTNSPEADLFPTVTLGDNTLHAAWITTVDSTYKIAYMMEQNDSTHFEIIEQSLLGEFGSGAAPFIISIDDLPHIFYRGIHDFGYHIHHAYKTHQDSSWTIEYLAGGNLEDYTASAVVDNGKNIHLVMSGNDGFGMPGRIYYMHHNYQIGIWSIPVLVTDTCSAVNATVAVMENGTVFVASCGTNGNMLNGIVYLSNNATGVFETNVLTTYSACLQPEIAMISGLYGAMVLDVPIGGTAADDYEIVYYGPSVSVLSDDEPIPRSSLICGNYPNPFNSSTIIKVEGQNIADGALTIFNLLGEKVRNLAPTDIHNSGAVFSWDGKSNDGVYCANGIYIYEFKSGTQKVHNRMMLLK